VAGQGPQFRSAGQTFRIADGVRYPKKWLTAGNSSCTIAGLADQIRPGSAVISGSWTNAFPTVMDQCWVNPPRLRVHPICGENEPAVVSGRPGGRQMSPQFAPELFQGFAGNECAVFPYKLPQNLIKKTAEREHYSIVKDERFRIQVAVAVADVFICERSEKAE
jgi:hypothetical protein